MPDQYVVVTKTERSAGYETLRDAKLAARILLRESGEPEARIVDQGGIVIGFVTLGDDPDEGSGRVNMFHEGGATGADTLCAVCDRPEKWTVQNDGASVFGCGDTAHRKDGPGSTGQ